jgi:AraC-like DNA-binding protein
VRREDALAIAGLRAEELTDPDALVDYEALPRLWTGLVDRFPDEPLGLRYSQLVSITSLGVVGYAIGKAPDFRAALDVYCRFCRLVDPYLKIVLEPRGSLHRIVLDHEQRVVEMGEPVEMMIAGLYRLGLGLNPALGRPAEVCFRHAQRHDAAVYREAFAGVLPRFEAEYTGAAFETAVLDLPISGGDAREAAYLTRYAEGLLEQLGPVAASDPIDARVRAEIDARLLDDAGEHRVARALGMSVRTLQRALQGAGTSFSEQLDAVRRTRALALLSRRDLSVAEVAFALGYSDPRAFYRSFKRWTGKTPREYRDVVA